MSTQTITDAPKRRSWIFRWAARLAVLLAIIIAVAATAFLFYGRDNFWVLVAGPPSQRTVEFPTLELKPTANQFLVCPPGYCREATPDRLASTYNVPSSGLRRALLEVINEDPASDLRVSGATASETLDHVIPRIVVDETGGNTLRVVVRSLVFRFPDVVSIEVIPVDERRSTLALYSRSQIGRYDFGQNRQRIDDWLLGLKARLPVEKSDGGVPRS